MSKITILFLAVLFATIGCSDDSGGIEENIFTGNLTLDTQEKVDNFNYTSIDGSLKIGIGFNGQDSNITDLSNLSTLTSVNFLSIDYNSQLVSLKGFENVKTINKLYISHNEQLSDISALSNLEVGVNELSMRSLPSLESLGGLKMRPNARQIYIREAGIISVDEFESLVTIKTLRLNSLPNLNSVQGLINLKTIDENLTLYELPKLKSLEGFNNLQAIPAEINFRDMGFINFEGFNNVISAKEINVEDCPDLTSLTGFDSLEEIDGNLGINNCENLESTGDFDNLTVIKGSLNIDTVDSLNSLEGFSALTKLGGLYLNSCTALTSLEGLHNLTFGASGLFLSSLPNLESIEALSNWTGDVYSSSSTGVFISNLSKLNSLEGLNFQKIYTFKLENLPNLSSLVGAEDITTINRLIIDNVSINDLAGLNSLKYVHETNIDNCNLLQNLDGTNLIDDDVVTSSYYSKISIHNNPQLSNYCGFTEYANNTQYLYVGCTGNQYNPDKSLIRSNTECSQ